ncbi:MAG TPA: LysE family transporter [bacterium]|nr:LysE family transporter [bacterium]
MVFYLLQGMGLGLAAAAQPGPFQTYVISQTLDLGWKRALPVCLAPLITDGPIILLALVVLSRLSGWFEPVLYTASGLFILYLSYKAFQRWLHFTADDAGTPSSVQSLGQAVVMNAISPGPYIYWSLVTGPILLAGWRETPFHGLAFLAGFYGAMISVLAGIIVMFGAARQWGPRIRRALLGLSALALAGFGVYQIWHGAVGG